MLYITTACLSLRSYPFSPSLSPSKLILSQQWQPPTTFAQFTPPSPLLTPILRQFAHHITPSPLVSILIIHKYINIIFSSNIIISNTTSSTSSISYSCIICNQGNLLRPYQVVVRFPVLQVLEGDVEQGPSAWHHPRSLLPHLT